MSPAMKETTGFWVPLLLMNSAASSSAEPPISPIMMMPWVCITTNRLAMSQISCFSGTFKEAYLEHARQTLVTVHCKTIKSTYVRPLIARIKASYLKAEDVVLQALTLLDLPLRLPQTVERQSSLLLCVQISSFAGAGLVGRGKALLLHTSGSSTNFSKQSTKFVPLNGSPPIPTTVL